MPRDDEIPDREAFAAFLRRLHENCLQRGAEWENTTLDRFLEALASWVEDSPGWYRNHDVEMPERGDWTYFARALEAATLYE